MLTRYHLAPQRPCGSRGGGWRRQRRGGGEFQVIKEQVLEGRGRRGGRWRRMELQVIQEQVL